MRICEMYLCEAKRLSLKPGTLYRFSVEPGCQRCTDAERAAEAGTIRPVVDAEAVRERLREHAVERIRMDPDAETVDMTWSGTLEGTVVRVTHTRRDHKLLKLELRPFGHPASASATAWLTPRFTIEALALLRAPTFVGGPTDWLPFIESVFRNKRLAVSCLTSYKDGKDYRTFAVVKELP